MVRRFSQTVEFSTALAANKAAGETHGSHSMLPQRTRSERSSNTEQVPGATQHTQPSVHVRHTNLTSVVPYQAGELASVIYHS